MAEQSEVLLLHMRDAATDILSFIEARERTDLDTDRQLVFALVKAIEIIGEAANHLPNDIKDVHPQIPWGDIIGMRNRLVHSYYDINLDTLWQTASEDIPALLGRLIRILETHC